MPPEDSLYLFSAPHFYIFSNNRSKENYLLGSSLFHCFYLRDLVLGLLIPTISYPYDPTCLSVGRMVDRPLTALFLGSSHMPHLWVFLTYFWSHFCYMIYYRHFYWIDPEIFFLYLVCCIVLLWRSPGPTCSLITWKQYRTNGRKLPINPALRCLFSQSNCYE